MLEFSAGAAVAMGVIVGLVSTCVQSVGLTLQRKSHMLEDEKADFEPHRPAYRRRRWQIGMFLFLFANIVGSTIQITTLPLPLLSTLQASGLVFNSILASLILKEPWTWRTVYGTILVAAGAVLISLFSALPEPSHTLEQLLILLRMPGFLVWFILSLLFVVVVLVMDFFMRKIVSGRLRGSPKIYLIRGMSYGLVSGILSAHALLLAKSAAELIVRSIADKDNQFRRYESWLLLLAFLILAVSQLYYLHLGLKLISTSILYPFVFCIYNVVAILDGLIYFRQMDRLPPLHAGLIGLGTVILLLGVLALSLRLQDDSDRGQQNMAQTEIPQTLLTPGSGFAADPPDDDANESAVLSDEDESETPEESTGLLKRDRARSSVGNIYGRKRRRAATLKEVSDIWHELEDEEENAYGTFDASANPLAARERLTSAGHERQRRRRRSSSGLSLEDDAEEVSLEQGPLPRSQTMPSMFRRSGSGKRRRSGQEGGALFSDLLSKDWWRKQKDYDDEDIKPSAESSRRSSTNR